MKLQSLAITAIITLSSTASASWFKGIDFTNINNETSGNTSSWQKGNSTGATDGAAQANGWGTAQGNADGEVNFTMNLKAKGHTSMDTQVSADAQGETSNNGLANFTGAGNSAGNIHTNGAASNDTNAKGVFPSSQDVPMFPPAPTPSATTQVPFAPAAPQVNNTLYIPNNS